MKTSLTLIKVDKKLTRNEQSGIAAVLNETQTALILARQPSSTLSKRLTDEQVLNTAAPAPNKK